MKRCISIIMIVFMVLTNILINSEAVFAAPTAPIAGAIIVTNNLEGKTDTVYVYGVNSGDLVKIYNSDKTNGKVIAYATVPKNKIDITFKIKQLGTEAGSVYVSVVSGGQESSRTKVDYDEEPKSVFPKDATFHITNNAQKADTITVSGLNARDVVKAYNSAGILLGSKTVSSSGNNVTISVSQLGSEAGSVGITVTSKNMRESDKTPVTYIAEPKSIKPSQDDITINNNVKKSDTICVSGLSGGDVVKVYNSATAGKLLGSKKVSSSGYDVTITIPQLITKDGYIYVTITSSELAESPRTPVKYPCELGSAELNPKYIIVTNNAGKPDTVYVTGLMTKDVIKVYDDITKGKLLGTATASATGGDATVSIAQLPLIDPEIKVGEIYVSVTSTDMNESTRVAASYRKEGKTDSISETDVMVTNNVGKADTVYVSNLIGGDTIKVYNSAGKVLGSSTVTASGYDTTISIPQLGTAKGNVYISVTQPGSQESGKIKVKYSAEGASTPPNINNIVVTNNVAKPDTVYINNLLGNDIVRIYDSATPGKILGTATVTSSATEATVTISQLGTAAGSVYVAVTSSGMSESKRIAVKYEPESISDGTTVDNIMVTNNAGKPDTVYITRLSIGDLVKVYATELGGTAMGSATADSNTTDVLISISQLGNGEGNVYVTITSSGASESKRIKVPYAAEAKSVVLTSDQIVVTNNVKGIADTIEVSGLNTGDVIKVYNAETKANRLGTATVAAGDTTATISVTQLGATDGSVYVSVTSTGKQESDSIEVKYTAEGKSTPTTSIKVTNNAGAADTVYVSGLDADDVVKVYGVAKGGKVLGSAIVTTYSSDTTVSIAQLGRTAGKVYVTVSSPNKSESEREEASYEEEPTSAKPTKITVINNAGSSDVVEVTGLIPGDVVKVYDTDAGGIMLGSATVSANSIDTTVTVAQLGSSEGKIYVSVTSINKLESERTPADYVAETKPKAIDATQVTIENNSGVASTVTIKGLKDKDIVNVYDAISGGNLLGTGTVAIYNSEVTISVSHLSATGGDVYISVTSTGKLESDRTAVHYDEKAGSTAPSASSVTIENNYGIADTITITNLDVNTVIKVYGTETGGSILGTATVASDSSKATISITQLGTSEGTVYITVTNTGKAESNRTKVDYVAEDTSDALALGNIAIVNNSGMADTITITGLELNSIVKVYNAAEGGSKLATVTVDTSTLATTINISQLGTESGSIYLSVTRPGKSESKRTGVQYEAESVAAAVSSITILNYAGMSDSITVTGLSDNDIIKAYDAASNGNLLGSAMVATGSCKAIITIGQLTQNAGNVYVSVTNYGRAESKLTRASYIAEQNATAPYIGDIHVVNNVDIADTITVYNLAAGDVIVAYNDDSYKDLLGYATAAYNKTEATISVEDLGEYAGILYVSVITRGKNESDCTAVSYVAEGKSTAPYSGYITVVNNTAGTADTITITKLTSGNIIKVYDAASDGNLLKAITVPAGSTTGTVTIAQLGTSAGSIYVTVTSAGRAESKRVKIDFNAE